MKVMLDNPAFTPYHIFYIESILFNCTSVRRSDNVIEALFSRFEKDRDAGVKSELPTTALLGEMQNITIHAGSISRFLWPSPTKDKEMSESHKIRGETLRKVLDVNDNSPLKNRGLRNAIEHFDERLDKYLSSEITGNIFPEYVGPRPEDDGVPRHIFRAYFIDDYTFVLLNEEFDLFPLIDEVYRVAKILEGFKSKGGVFRL